MTVNLEKIFFAFVMDNKRYFHLVEPNYFKNREIEFVYGVLRSYIICNPEAEMPKPAQILEMVSLEDRDGMITKEILKSMLTVKLHDYDIDNFIVPKLNAWILSNRLRTGAVDIVDETRSLENKSDLDSVMGSAMKIRTIVEQMSNVNFVEDDDLGSDFDNPESHIQDTAKFKIKTGFDTIDHMLGGGWDIQTLSVLMAETNGGKCFFEDGYIKVKNTEKNTEKNIKIGKIFTMISNGDYNF